MNRAPACSKLAVLALSTILLTACGLKGDLYLEESAAAPAPDAAVQAGDAAAAAASPDANPSTDAEADAADATAP